MSDFNNSYLTIPALCAVVMALIMLAWLFRIRLMAMNMINWLHWASFFSGLGQIVFILWYYVPLMQLYMSDSGLDTRRDKFISDFLFSDSVYRSVMTFFVALQLGMCVLFVARLRSKLLEGAFMFCVEISLFVFAWVGWTVLCAQYTSPDSGEGMSKVHAAGVGVFISCSLAYVTMLSWNVFVLFSRQQFNVYVIGEFVLFGLVLVTSVGLGIHFIVHSLQMDPDAWVTEHLALVFFVSCHMLLFIIDSSHSRLQCNELAAGPARQEKKCTTTTSSFVIPVGDANVFDGVRIQFRR
jgi:hypothetical protein